MVYERLATWTAANPYEPVLAETFLQMVASLSLYTVYCNNFDDAMQELARIEKKRPEFKHFLDVGQKRARNPLTAPPVPALAHGTWLGLGPAARNRVYWAPLAGGRDTPPQQRLAPAGHAADTRAVDPPLRPAAQGPTEPACELGGRMAGA